MSLEVRPQAIFCEFSSPSVDGQHLTGPERLVKAHKLAQTFLPLKKIK